MEREGKQGEDGRPDRDEDWANSKDSSVNQSVAQLLALFVTFFNEVEQDDHVAHDHPDQTRDSKDHHESEWHVHEPDA